MSILALTSNTLIGTAAAGNIEYNGQFYGTDSAASRAQMQRITQGTAVASTSGTSIDFTSLPAWVKKITVMFNGVSTNGTSNLIVQIGTGGTPKTSGYLGTADTWSTGVNATLITNGFGLTRSISATSILNGNAIISTSGSNAWSSMGMLGSSESAFMHVGAGSVSLSGTLDMVRITTVGGTNTFDAGSINILYEG